MAAERIPQSVTIRVPLQAYLSSDHVSPATGKTIAIVISKNGAAYGNPSGGATNATEIGNGSYYVDLSTTDTGTTGPLFVRGTEGTIDQIITIYNVVNANNGGLAALPNAAAEAAGGLYTRGTGAGQINQAANGMIDTNPVRLNNVAQSLLDLKDFADDGYDPATNKVQGVVLVDTLTTYTGDTPQTGDAYAVVNSGTFGNAAIKTQTAAIETDTQDIQSRLPAALVSGRMDSSVGAMASNTLTAAALAADAVTEIQSGLATQASVDDLPTNAELATALAGATITAVSGAVGSVTGNVGGNVGGNVTGSVGSVAAGGIAAASFAAGAITATVLATDAIGATELSTGAAEKIADITLRRTTANAEASSNGDTLDGESLLGAVEKMVSKIDQTTNPGFITVFRADGTTQFYTQAIVTDNTAEPITEIGEAS